MTFSHTFIKTGSISSSLPSPVQTLNYTMAISTQVIDKLISRSLSSSILTFFACLWNIVLLNNLCLISIALLISVCMHMHTFLRCCFIILLDPFLIPHKICCMLCKMLACSVSWLQQSPSSNQICQHKNVT